jgi:SecD/SecF fusion protein
MDLNMIAALLTITGYSLNDKIIILDRIRENKGKLPYASYKVINDSINQTLSRTFITAGTTLFSTIVLYIYGGEGIRGFAYAFTLGVFIGTYTSIVSSPLVWSRKQDKLGAERPFQTAATGPTPGQGSPGA